MKKFLVAMLLVATSLTMVVSEVNAKRLGSGNSAGRQSSNVTRQQAAPPTSAVNQPKPATPAATPPKPASPWKGIVGGLIGGALLGALFSSMGLGGALSGILGTVVTMALFAGLALLLFKLYQNRKNANARPSARSSVFNQPGQPAFAGMPSVATPEIGSRLQPQANTSAFGSGSSNFGAVAPQAPWGVPVDFDVPAFLRSAKTYFIRLQAAWDTANLNDIREFTTTEMFAEIRMDLQDRGTAVNVTDVVTIEAELLGVETVGGDYLASVKFSGMIKENPNAQAEPFNEVWNLSKPVNGGAGWLLAGIQQLS